MSTLRFTTFSKLFKKADFAVSALTVFPTIPDLAEAWELRIKYAYAELNMCMLLHFLIS